MTQLRGAIDSGACGSHAEPQRGVPPFGAADGGAVGEALIYESEALPTCRPLEAGFRQSSFVYWLVALRIQDV